MRAASGARPDADELARALFYMKAELVVDIGADVARGAPRELEEAAFHEDAPWRVSAGSSTANTAAA